MRNTISDLARRKDLLMLLLITVVVGAVFNKTILLGEPVSKVCMVAEWDSVFREYAKGKLFPMDSTMVLMLIPAYLAKAELWRAGQIPLWNQLNGLGCPMLGDPQSLVLTPLHLLLVASPTMRAYNLTLVLEVVVMALGMYALCRTIKLPPYSSLFGSVTLTFCPFLLWYMEILGNGYCLIPLLFTMFARAARVPTKLRCSWAGVSCAILVLSSHPEISFFAITFASLFFCICRTTLCLDDRNGTADILTVSKLPIWQRAAASLFELAIAAVVALCLSAPVLIPFAEFLANSESYKFDLRNPARMPLETLGFNLLQPTFGGASPFLGVVALACLPLSLFSKPRKSKLSLIVFGLALFALAIGAKLWPINLLLLNKPFAYLIANYCFPVLLVLTTILASLGFQNLCQFARLGWLDPRRGLGLGCVFSLCLLSCAFFSISKALDIELSAANFDMCVPSAVLTKRDWMNDSIFIALFLLLASVRPLWKNRLRTFSIIGCLAVGFASQALVAKASMPVQARFEYPNTDITQNLRNDTSHRYIATGNHLLRPNTGSVYGISDLRQVNPIFPARYVKFMESAGAKIDDFNQVFSGKLSPLLNLASVSSCLTQTPVVEETAWNDIKSFAIDSPSLSVNEKSIAVPAEVAPGLTIESINYADTTNSGTFGEYRISAAPDAINRYTIGFVLLGGKGETLWFGDQTIVSSSGTFSYSVPTQGYASPMKLGIHVFDLKTSAFIVPQERYKGKSDVLTFAEIVERRLQSRQKQIDSWGVKPPLRCNGNIFVYFNSSALAESFIVHRARTASGAADALNYMKRPMFDPATEVILETTNSSQPAQLQSTNSKNDFVRLQRQSATHITIETQSQSPGWLVLTDIFYPGWQSKIDSKDVEILRANYAFRAIELPAGKHIVEFEYKPITVVIGFALAFICIAGLGAAHCFQFLSARKAKLQS